MKKQEILDYLEENEDWILQYCRGVGGDGWWWLRDTINNTRAMKVNGNSAAAASKLLTRVSGSWRETNYAFKKHNSSVVKTAIAMAKI